MMMMRAHKLYPIEQHDECEQEDDEGDNMLEVDHRASEHRC